MDITLLQIQNGTNTDLINFKTEIIVYLQNKKFSTKSITLVKTLKMIDKELNKRHEGRLNLVREISFDISRKTKLENKKLIKYNTNIPLCLQEKKLQTKFIENNNEDLIWRLFTSEETSYCSDFLGNKITSNKKDEKEDHIGLENIFNRIVSNDFKEDKDIFENIERKESKGSDESILSTTNSSYSENEQDSINQEKIKEKEFWKSKFCRVSSYQDLSLKEGSY